MKGGVIMGESTLIEKYFQPPGCTVLCSSFPFCRTSTTGENEKVQNRIRKYTKIAVEL